jgi:hypothetical protein
MITFKQFLAEENEPMSIEELAQKIKQDCKPWLDSFGDTKLYRGVKFTDPMLRPLQVAGYQHDDLNRVFIGAVRNDRKPRDIQKAVHNRLDSMFVSKVGVPLRSASLFVTKSYDTASGYGRIVRIFPIGEFHYAWSPYFDDPYSLFVDGEIPENLTSALSEVMPNVRKKYPKMLRVDDLSTSPVALAYALTLIPNVWKFDEGLLDADDSCEIMLVCDKFYAMGYDVAREILGTL